MSRMTTTLDEQGKVEVPDEVRRLLGLEAGGEVVFVLDEKGVHLRPSRKEGYERAKALVRQYIPEGVSLSEELLEDRRREALNE